MFPQLTAILLLLSIFASPLASGSTQTTPPAATDGTLPSFKLEDYLKTFPPAERAEKLTALAEARVIFSDASLPGVFDELLSGQALDKYMDSWDEPLESANLDALERLVQSQKSASARFRASVLLVRYGRDGQIFLAEQLRSGNQQSARRATGVRAVAQLPGTQQALVAALVNSEKTPDWRWAAALARCPDDELAQALSKALIAEPSRTDLVVAQPKPLTMPPEIGLHYQFSESPGDQTQQLSIASALIRMDQLSARPAEYLRRELQRPSAPFPLWKSYVVDAMGLSGSQKFRGDLRIVIDDAIAQGSKAERTRDEKSRDAGTRRQNEHATRSPATRALRCAHFERSVDCADRFPLISFLVSSNWTARLGARDCSSWCCSSPVIRPRSTSFGAAIPTPTSSLRDRCPRSDRFRASTCRGNLNSSLKTRELNRSPHLRPHDIRIRASLAPDRRCRTVAWTDLEVIGQRHQYLKHRPLERTSVAGGKVVATDRILEERVADERLLRRKMHVRDAAWAVTWYVSYGPARSAQVNDIAVSDERGRRSHAHVAAPGERREVQCWLSVEIAFEFVRQNRQRTESTQRLINTLDVIDVAVRQRDANRTQTFALNECEQRLRRFAAVNDPAVLRRRPTWHMHDVTVGLPRAQRKRGDDGAVFDHTNSA